MSNMLLQGGENRHASAHVAHIARHTRSTRRPPKDQRARPTTHEAGPNVPLCSHTGTVGHIRCLPQRG
eukprot:15475186-Alexandrium_andersonii.AAC.1